MPRGPEPGVTKYVVRLYDGFDNQWIDIGEPCTYDEALALWNTKTANGTRQTKYADIDYFDIFPADTSMLFSGGFGARD